MAIVEEKDIVPVHVDDTSRIQDRDDDPYEEVTRLNFQTIMACLALSGQYNAYIFTLLISSTTLPYIVADLGTQSNYVWITVAWNLAAAVLVTLGGRLADIFGRRYFMMAGNILGLIGAIVGATGQSINQMIASGILFGLGGGFQEMAYACVQEIVPNKWRLYAVGSFDLSATFAFTSPLIAYAFIAHTSIGWRGAYWFMVAWEAFALIILFFFYKPPSFETKHRTDGKTKIQLLKELDYVGVVLFVAGLTLLLLGINWGGRDHPWKSGHVIGTIVVGFVALFALGFWEVHAEKRYPADSFYPILPPKLFRKVRSFTMIIVVVFVSGMLYYSMNVLWPRQSQLLFAPATEPITLGGILVFTLGTRLGHQRWQLTFYICAQTALVGSLSTVSLNDHLQAIITVVALSSMVTPPQLLAFGIVSLGLEDQSDIGVAVGLTGTSRLIGGAFATAIYTSILNNKFASSLLPTIKSQIPEALLSPQLIAAIRLNTAAAYKAVPGITPTLIAEGARSVKLAYVEAYRLVYLIALAFGGVAIVCAVFTKSIEKKNLNEGRAVYLENEKGGKDVDGDDNTIA